MKRFLFVSWWAFVAMAEPIQTKSRLKLQSGKPPELTIEAQGSLLDSLGVIGPPASATPVVPPVAPAPTAPSVLTDSDEFFDSVGKDSPPAESSRRRGGN